MLGSFHAAHGLTICERQARCGSKQNIDRLQDYLSRSRGKLLLAIVLFRNKTPPSERTRDAHFRIDSGGASGDKSSRCYGNALYAAF
jgi:hypothetical protein